MVVCPHLADGLKVNPSTILITWNFWHPFMLSIDLCLTQGLLLNVRLALDNSTAVAYIDNMGGVRSPLLDSLSRGIWEWCKLRDIFISAQHIPGKVNNQADTLSREISSNLEWSLNSEVFHEIISQTFIPEIDLFASRLMPRLQSLSPGAHSQVWWLPMPFL